MNISEQIKELRELSDAYTAGGHKNVGDKLKQAADTIESLHVKLEEQKWTLYIDRLPPEPPKVAQTKEELEEMISNGTLQEYLVTLNSGGRVTTLYYAGDSYWYDQEKELLLVVIAWKHLPESYIYKEGDNQ